MTEKGHQKRTFRG